MKNIIHKLISNIFSFIHVLLIYMYSINKKIKKTIRHDFKLKFINSIKYFYPKNKQIISRSIQKYSKNFLWFFLMNNFGYINKYIFVSVLH